MTAWLELDSIWNLATQKIPIHSKYLQTRLDSCLDKFLNTPCRIRCKRTRNFAVDIRIPGQLLKT